jgi:HK97 family phage major capsid protein
MIAKQIAALEEQRTAKVKAMEDMVGKAEGEARGLNDDEKGTFADLKKSITDLDSRLDDLRATEKLVATKAAPVVVESPKASIQVGGVRREKGTFFARLAHALYMNQGNHFAAAEYAKSHLGDEELASVLRMPKGALERAASALGTTGDNAFAKPLTTIRQASEEFIDMLRPASVFARVPARRMNFDGNSSIVIPRQTAGASGTWVGEGAAIPVKKLAFDSINLTPKKMAVIVGVTNELLSHSSPAVEAIIRDDMIRSTATYLDTCFLDNTVNSSSRPGGLQVYDAAPTTSAGPTLADITTDLAALMADMLNANVPMNRPVWIMNPVNVNALM